MFLQQCFVSGAYLIGHDKVIPGPAELWLDSITTAFQYQQSLSAAAIRPSVTINWLDDRARKYWKELDK